MRARALALVGIAAAAGLLASACAAKHAPATSAAAAPTAQPSPSATPERAANTATVPVTLWHRDAPFDVLTPGLSEKNGVLRKTPPPTGESYARSWPYSVDLWGIARTDLSPLLGPYEGAPIRVRGVFRKVYAEDHWYYEVDPEEIVLLPAKKN